MARGIYSAVPPPDSLASTTATTAPAEPAAAPAPSHPSSGAVDIEAWTVQALQSLSISPAARGTGTPLAIPLDDHHRRRDDDGAETPTPARQMTLAISARRTTPTPRPPSARDSQRRREMLHKGNEGSRQRRRWENDRLIGVPNAQPPIPSDWEVRPTHTVHHVPYHIAQYWDRGVRERAEDKAAALQAARRRQQRAQVQSGKGTATSIAVGQVPRDLRESARRKPAVRGWVRVLEEPVRSFLVQQRKDAGAAAGDETTEDEVDSEDEEIVFVGRKAGQQRGKVRKAHREVGDQNVDEGLVFDSLVDDETASFRRWLTHSISDYYGLESRSVTMGGRRVVYVSVKATNLKRVAPLWTELPKPLWEIC